MSELLKLQDYVIRSAKNGAEALGFKPIDEKTVADFFEVYSLGIPVPMKVADHEMGRAWCGYIDIPGEEIMCVFIATIVTEVVLASNGNIPRKSLYFKPEAAVRVQNELFQHYWKTLQNQINRLSRS